MNTATTMPAGVKALTVTQITLQIKNAMEGKFPNVWVLGEVSKVNLHRSGHLYFDIKDDGALLHVVITGANGDERGFGPDDREGVSPDDMYFATFRHMRFHPNRDDKLSTRIPPGQRQYMEWK